MAVHQQFKAGLDTKGYESGLVRMENTTRTSSSRIVREMDKTQQAANRAGGSKGSMRAGQVAMQMQDIGVQMQMGAKASTIIAQQGSQILSVFGPAGMLLGGLTAAGAMFWEVTRGAKALNKEAQEARKSKSLEANTSATRSAFETLKADQDAAKVARIRAMHGNEIAAAAERELAFKRKIKDIEDNGNLERGAKDAFIEGANERKEAEDAARFREQARNRREGMVDEGGNAIINRANQIRGQAPSKAEARREFRAQRAAERRAINELADEKDRARRNEPASKRSKIDGRTTGLTAKEREDIRQGQADAVAAAKDPEIMAAFSDEQLIKIVNSIEGLLAK